MTEDNTHLGTRGTRFGRWIRMLSCTLVVAFLGTQGIAALPFGTATDHMYKAEGSGYSTTNPFNYTLFCFGDASFGVAEGAHSQGAMAIGGNASFYDFSFAGSNAGSLGLSQLVVGGTLSYGNLHNLAGNIEVNGTDRLSGSSYEFTPNTYGVVSPVSVDFGSVKDKMVSRANSADAFADSNSNAKLSNCGGGKYEVAPADGFDTSNDVIVFNMPSDATVLYVPAYAKVIINVKGDSVSSLPQLRFGTADASSSPNDAGDERDLAPEHL